MNAIAKRRYDRIAQAQHRGSAVSHETGRENALILLAWEAAELSEGQAAKALQIDILGVRDLRAAYLAEALVLFEALRPLRPEPPRL